jgi:DNA-directed RNA polymerase subunit RPC12/RpoP
MSTRCRECGSERIAPNVKVAEASGAPVTGLLSQLRASVCADCGRVTLRAENALEVYLAERGEAGRPAADTAAPAANIQCPSCGSVLSAAATACEVCGWSPPAR